ncbi:hypothetical protein [Sphingobium sp. CAP-1]|uniref:hypothetical protein n=1 Tax=Sphingobium sp. CAP-1 TaxID=2676077 RepID=UPI0012BB24BE|nr:hypothetical protein [Sphingobium sp. CAP-1]QGP78199.1 hypothetical protein GL174_03710 [Sphingobium sp. CAP-1]
MILAGSVSMAKKNVAVPHARKNKMKDSRDRRAPNGRATFQFDTAPQKKSVMRDQNPLHLL